MTLANFKLDANCDLKIAKPVINEKNSKFEGWEDLREMITTIRFFWGGDQANLQYYCCVSGMF